MRRHALPLAFLLAASFAQTARAATIDDKTRLPDVVSPGQTVVIAGSFATDTPKAATFKLRLVGSDQATATMTAKVSDDRSKLEVALPQKLDPGRYFLTVDYDDLLAAVVPGELHVAASAVQLDDVNPTTAYHNNASGFDFDIIGKNFAEARLDDNKVYISGQGQIIQQWSVTRSKDGCDHDDRRPCLWVESTEKLHVVGYNAQRYQGPLMFSVGVGATRSTEKRLTLARRSEAQVLIICIIAFLVLALMVYAIVSRGMKDNLINGQRYSPFWSFFIDRATNSYSLSKFQLLVFSAVFVFSYLYVFLCQWLVQWRFTLPDVPPTFAAILGMSAGTTLLAAGAAATRGNKGAGPSRPSVADFITTGGQVVPERFQFFVWTIVASIGFVALLVSQNPAALNGFPEFPQGLLYVMGISAAGYIGGKVTRAGGPVIRNIAWDDKEYKVIVQGENLSSEADYGIDGKKLPIDPQATGSLVTPTPQAEASDRTFCSQLAIKVNAVAGVDLSRGDHVFRLTNKDGQYAEAPFTVDAPKVDAVSSNPPSAPPPETTSKLAIPAGKNEIEVLVTGSGFRPGMAAKWTPSMAKDPIDLGPTVAYVDATIVKVKLVPGDKGIGMLLLSTPTGFTALGTVTVF